MAQPIDFGQQLSGSRIEELVSDFNLVRGGGFGLSQVQTAQLQVVASRVQQRGDIATLLGERHRRGVRLGRALVILFGDEAGQFDQQMFRRSIARQPMHGQRRRAACQHGRLLQLAHGGQTIGFRQDAFCCLLIGVVRGRLGRRDRSRLIGRTRGRRVVGMQPTGDGKGRQRAESGRGDGEECESSAQGSFLLHCVKAEIPQPRVNSVRSVHGTSRSVVHGRR